MPLHMTSGMSFNQSNNGPLGVVGGHPGAWVFSDWIIDKAGHPATGNILNQSGCAQSRAASTCIGTLREVLGV